MIFEIICFANCSVIALFNATMYNAVSNHLLTLKFYIQLLLYLYQLVTLYFSGTYIQFRSVLHSLSLIAAVFSLLIIMA